jgi:hypothetical protein
MERVLAHWPRSRVPDSLPRCAWLDAVCMDDLRDVLPSLAVLTTLRRPGSMSRCDAISATCCGAFAGTRRGATAHGCWSVSARTRSNLAKSAGWSVFPGTRREAAVCGCRSVSPRTRSESVPGCSHAVSRGVTVLEETSNTRTPLGANWRQSLETSPASGHRSEPIRDGPRKRHRKADAKHQRADTLRTPQRFAASGERDNQPAGRCLETSPEGGCRTSARTRREPCNVSQRAKSATISPRDCPDKRVQSAGIARSWLRDGPVQRAVESGGCTRRDAALVPE